MRNTSIVIFAIFALASCTQFQEFKGVLHGQWSNTCFSKFSIVEGSSLNITEGPGKNVTLTGINFLEEDSFNCSITDVSAQDVYIDGFSKYSPLEANVTSKSKQFAQLNCTKDTFSDSPSSSSDTNGTLFEKYDLHITVMNLAGGVLLNFASDPDCSVFLTDAKEFNVTNLTTVASADACNCSTVCFRGDTNISSFEASNSDADSWSATVHVDQVEGSYISGTNDTDSLKNVTLSCSAEFVPDYPSPVVEVEDCVWSDAGVVTNGVITLTYLDDSLIIVGDQSDPTCFSILLSQEIMAVSLFVALVSGLVNML